MKVLRQAVRSLIVRGEVTRVEDGAGRQVLQVAMLEDEVKTGAEHMQRYGLTTHPPEGAEAVVLNVSGNRDHSIVIAVEHREFRLRSLEAGEVALYDDRGQVIRLARDGIEIEAPDGIRINGNVTVTGDVMADGISLKTHTHGQVDPGSGTSGMPNG
ncbi:MAG: phage baseplate assembly protein V [Pseudomonadota bacterium]